MDGLTFIAFIALDKTNIVPPLHPHLRTFFFFCFEGKQKCFLQTVGLWTSSWWQLFWLFAFAVSCQSKGGFLYLILVIVFPHLQTGLMFNKVLSLQLMWAFFKFLNVMGEKNVFNKKITKNLMCIVYNMNSYEIMILSASLWLS